MDTEESVARVQQICEEEFPGLSSADKEAIRAVQRMMHTENTTLRNLVDDYRKEIARLADGLVLTMAAKRKEQVENTVLRETLERRLRKDVEQAIKHKD